MEPLDRTPSTEPGAQETAVHEVSPDTRVELLAAEYLDEIHAGGEPALDEFARRLPSPPEQDLFRRLVGDALRIAGLLPRQVEQGAMLAGRYRLFHQIGSGGMGKVYEAVDTRLGRRVAIKVLSSIGSGSLDSRELFAKESRLLAGLDHPNIVTVHEAGSEGDVHYAVMDLVHGAALSDVLDRARRGLTDSGLASPRAGRLLIDAIGLPVPEGTRQQLDPESWFGSACRLMVVLARTIEAAHGQGVVHRDLKPGNVMLRGDGSPVILDFGLGGQIDQHAGTVTQGLFGSPAYLAPEQARAHRVGCDTRTDVYQLGVILYELLTLRRAFPDEGLGTLLDKIGRGAFRRPREIDRRVPSELEAVCLRAMELDPARRYQGARELADDLQRYLDGNEPPLAARGGALGNGLRNTRYFVRRHRGRSLVAASVLLAGLAVWSYVLYLSNPAAAELRAFALTEGTDEERWVSPGGALRPGEVLGVRIEAAAPQYVYAVSVFGDEDDPRAWLCPMVPLAPGGEPVGDWGLRLDVGEHLVACTKVDEEHFNAREGLWVFSSSARQPQLEAWLGRLAGPDPVAYEEAWDRLHVRTRGGALTGGGSQDVAALLSRLTPEQFSGGDDWPFEDPRRFEVLFRVEPVAD